MFKHAVFLNPDGDTLFGTPWEMNFIDSYLVRSKGGDAPGYSAMFGYIPELGLGTVYVNKSNGPLHNQVCLTLQNIYMTWSAKKPT